MDDVVSEVVVAADHQNIHNQPKAILEVRRILLEHLDHLRNQAQVAERLDGTAPGRVSNSESTTHVPLLQISTGARRVLAEPKSPDSWWLPKWLGESSSYSGTKPGESQQSMQELVDSAPKPATPKPIRQVPWLKAQSLGESSSRK